MIGLLAVFQDEERWLKAQAELAQETCYRDGFSPFAPETGNDDRSLLHRAAGFGALGGFLTAFVLQLFATVISAPLDIGGRPLFSWPAYIPVCFVLTLLGAGVTMAFTLFIKLKYPWLNHPVFAAKSFDLSELQFYIQLEGSPAEMEKLRARLQAMGASELEEIPCA